MLPFTARQLVDKLYSFLGTHETGGTPAGTGNLQDFSKVFGNNGIAWCAYFIGACMAWLGFDIRTVSGDFPWTPSFYSQARAAGWPFVAFDDLQLGDIAFIDWTGDGQIDHVCTVTGRPSGGSVPTIDGNLHNRVEEDRKVRGIVHSAVRPPYAVPAAPAASSGGSGSVGGSSAAAPDRHVWLEHIEVAIIRDGPAEDGHKEGFAPEVQIVEDALVAEGLLDASLADGSAGTSTFGSPSSAYGRWQQRCGWTGKDADGIPGFSSLSKLGNAHDFTVTGH